jgi:ankyrin repeat protein/beta-lactamase regulating signal transducer with metallopeptidase domain
MMDAGFLGSVLATHIWQSVALAALLAGVLIVGKRLSGDLRHGMAWAAFAASVILPIMAFVPGDGLLERVLKATHAPVTILPPSEVAAPVIVPDAHVDAQPEIAAVGSGLTQALKAADLAAWAAEAAAVEAGHAAAIAAQDAKQATEAAGGSPSYLSLFATSTIHSVRASLNGRLILQGFGLLWLVVSLGMIALVARDLVAVERLVARSRPATLSKRASQRYKGVSIAVSSEIAGPMAAGLTSPTILLPKDMADQIDTAEVAMFLEHERAHIERHDMLAALAQRVLLAIVWWSPALHWISRRIDEEREAACDEAAVARTGDPRSFARSLAKQAEAHICSPAPRLAVGALGPKSSIGRRLRRLVDFARRGTPGDTLKGRFALAFIILAAFGAGTLTPTLAIAQERKGESEDQEIAPLAVVPAAPAPPAWPAVLVPPAPPAPPEPPAQVAYDAASEAELDSLEAELGSLGAEIGAMVSSEVIDQLPHILSQVSFALSKAGLSNSIDQAEIQREIAQARRETSREIGESIREDIRQSLESAREEIEQAREQRADSEEARRDAMLAARDAMREARDSMAAARDRGEFKFDFTKFHELEGGGEKIKFKVGKNGKPADADARLIQAVRNTDVDEARAAIRAGAKVHKTGGSDLLRRAVRNGDADMVRLLLDQGANPNAVMPGDHTPLMLAVRNGDTDVTRVLLERGANTNAWMPGDPTALMMAARSGDTDMVRVLLDFGADANKVAPGDGTPLIAAIRSGENDIARLLVERGADVNRASPGDGNPLIAAAHNGDMDLVRLLVERRADVNAYVPGDETPLISAAAEGDIAVVRYLVERGANVNAAYNAPMTCRGKTIETRSALTMATCQGNDDIVAYLRSKGAK